MRPALRPLAPLAPAALLLLALTGCGASDGGAGTTSAPSTEAAPTASGTAASPSATSSPASAAPATSAAASPAGAWDPAPTEAALRELLGAGAQIETHSAQDVRGALTGQPDVDALGPKSPQDSAACTAARDAFTAAVADAVAGGVSGTAEGTDASGDSRSIQVTALRPGPEVGQAEKDAREACGLAPTASPTPSSAGELGPTLKPVTVGGASGVVVELISQEFEGAATGAPDREKATRSITVRDDAVQLTDMTTVTTTGARQPLDDYVAQQTPGLERVLQAARG